MRQRHSLRLLAAANRQRHSCPKLAAAERQRHSLNQPAAALRQRHSLSHRQLAASNAKPQQVLTDCCQGDITAYINCFYFDSWIASNICVRNVTNKTSLEIKLRTCTNIIGINFPGRHRFFQNATSTRRRWQIASPCHRHT
jgi:hypothetical protein